MVTPVANKVQESVPFSKPLARTLSATDLSGLIKQLNQTFNEFGRRLNNVLITDGSEGLESYTVATLPTSIAGALIYVSDETGGATIAFGDGTDWRRVQDRVIVS